MWEMSDFMMTATNNQKYISSYKILIPATWLHHPSWIKVTLWISVSLLSDLFNSILLHKKRSQSKKLLAYNVFYCCQKLNDSLAKHLLPFTKITEN